MSSITHRSRLISIVILSALVGCGAERSGPTELKWDQRAGAVVASYRSGGGMVPEMTAFLGRPYGSRFIRLMGDGTLFFGKPMAVKVRHLDEAQMQTLLQRMRADRFSGYKKRYTGQQATDMPTSTVSIDVQTYGKYTVSAYGGFSDGDGPAGDVPATLAEAVQVLEAAATGGQPLTPTGILVGARELKLSSYTTLDATQIRAWPVSEVDLDTLDLYSKAQRVSAAELVGPIVALFGSAKQVFSPTNDVVFFQKGRYFWVGFVALLPGPS